MLFFVIHVLLQVLTGVHAPPLACGASFFERVSGKPRHAQPAAAPSRLSSWLHHLERSSHRGCPAGCIIWRGQAIAAVQLAASYGEVKPFGHFRLKT